MYLNKLFNVEHIFAFNPPSSIESILEWRSVISVPSKYIVICLRKFHLMCVGAITCFTIATDFVQFKKIFLFISNINCKGVQTDEEGGNDGHLSFAFH